MVIDSNPCCRLLLLRAGWSSINQLLINKTDGFECLEKPISPFDLQKSDELFISNVIKGIQPITKYRKKIFETNVSKQLIDKLNLTFKV